MSRLTPADINAVPVAKLAEAMRAKCERAQSLATIASVDHSGAASWGALAAALPAALDSLKDAGANWDDCFDSAATFRRQGESAIADNAIRAMARAYVEAGGRLEVE